MLKNYTETSWTYWRIYWYFFLKKGAVDDFIKKINVDKVKQKLFGVMSGEKIIDVILEVATDAVLA